VVKLPGEHLVSRKRHFLGCSRLALASVVWLFAQGCERDATQLVVVVNTDYDVPAELGVVEVRISDLDGREISASEFTLTDAPDPADPTRFVVPFSFGIVPIDDDASRRIIVDVDGRSPARALRLTRRAVTGFVSGRTLVLPMFLARTCEEVVCMEGQTCTERGCVSATVDPGGLREARPGQELLDAAMDGGADATTDGSTSIVCGTDLCTCDSGPCSANCEAAGRCDVVCGAGGCVVSSTGTNFLAVECPPSAHCTVDAQTVSTTVVECREGSTCDVDCRDTPSCRVSCRGTTARCTIQCAGSPDCRMADCEPGGMMSCPDDVLVCGTPCP
jgi:hypothetical protein